MSIAWDTYGKRAIRAWLRSGGTDQPSSYSSTVEEVSGKNYIVLRNANGVLTVFQVKNDGTLRQLKHWPTCVN